MHYLNPLALGAVGAIGGAILAPLLVTAGLGVLGFSVAGPVAGTAAAAWQAGIGNVAAGSLFAGIQSVAVTGALPAAVTFVGAGVGGLGGAAVGTTTVGASVVNMTANAASAVYSGVGTAAGGLRANVSADI